MHTPKDTPVADPQFVKLITVIEAGIGFTFTDKQILVDALLYGTNRNQQLELVGDKVVGLLVTAALIKAYPDKKVGELTRLIAFLISERFLSHLAENTMLGEYIVFNAARSDRQSFAFNSNFRSEVLGDTFEAIVGAIFTDSGYEAAYEFLADSLIGAIGEVVEKIDFHDPTQALVRLCSKLSLGEPRYNMSSLRGGRRSCTIRCRDRIMGYGLGDSSTEARIIAARNALHAITADTVE